MKTYCLIFKPLSIISKLPDAQTIFGAICNIILNTQGQEAFDAYISSFNNQPQFLHSSMFPLGQLPMVNESLFSTEFINHQVLSQKVDKQLDYLQKMKQLKKIQWMSERIYSKYVVSNDIEKLRKDLMTEKSLKVEQNYLRLTNDDKMQIMVSQLNTHVQKNGVINPGENELYYDNGVYCDEDARFCIYIKSNLAKEKINEIFKYTHYFGLGDRHSVGKNSFKLIEIISKENVCSKDYKLLLSKSIIDNDFNLRDSFYSVESRIYRTTKGYLNNKLIGRINLLKEGSYMKVSSNKEWYGDIIVTEHSNKKAYYYGIGFIL